jgi:outer membrane protein OmpA-like peptidoglycan-associated protein
MTRVAPRMQTAAYLPPEFTLEFDVYFYGKGNEAYQVDFKGLKFPLEIRGSSLKMGALGGQTAPRKPGWQHVALSFNRGALKAYLGETRLVSTPDAGGTPVSYSIRALSKGAKAGIPSVIDNVRLAEGAVPLYTKLIADGRFTTRGIHFATASARLLGNSMGVINEVAKMMREHPEVNLAIEGHTDSDGADDMNLKLSQQRAAAVREALIAAGIAQGRLTAKGFGESKSVDSNATAEGKANNRRVEFAKI